MTRSAKNYCFTLNNYSEDDQIRLRTCFASNDAVVYLVFGRETAESGTRHLQGYISFSSRKTLNQAKAFVNERAHLEIARGTPTQNFTYCTKDGDFEEFGDRPAPAGKRTDLDGLAGAIRCGERLRILSVDYAEYFIRYPRGIEAYAGRHRPAWRASVTVFCFHGTTGTGKTWRVYNTEPDLYRYPNDGWFDGYDQHEAVLFDDYRPSEFKVNKLLEFIDQYPVQVRVKGSFVNFCPRRIYFTSNIDPKLWYRNIDEPTYDALMRRIHINLKFQRVDGEVQIIREWPE